MNGFEYEVNCIIESYVSEFGDYEPVHEIGDTPEGRERLKKAYQTRQDPDWYRGDTSRRYKHPFTEWENKRNYEKRLGIQSNANTK